VGHKNGQKIWVTEDPMGRHTQESSMRIVVKNNQKPVGMECAHVTSIKATSLGLDCLVIKHWSSPWFYQEAIALIGISGLIYLFI
jgi:hypothetical protein